jgi:hypothetical protein
LNPQRRFLFHHVDLANSALIRHQFSSNSVLAIMPEPLQWLLKTTRLAQSWSMFSPDPPEAMDGLFSNTRQQCPKMQSIY